MTDAQAKAKPQMFAIKECIVIINRLEGIEARANTAEWLANMRYYVANAPRGRRE